MWIDALYSLYPLHSIHLLVARFLVSKFQIWKPFYEPSSSCIIFSSHIRVSTKSALLCASYVCSEIPCSSLFIVTCIVTLHRTLKDESVNAIQQSSNVFTYYLACSIEHLILFLALTTTRSQCCSTLTNAQPGGLL